MTDIELTEEQAADLLRATRLRKGLLYAPELAEHLRRQMLPADGRTEVTAQNLVKADRATYGRPPIGPSPTPLLTGIVDAADELFVTLEGWARAWASVLKQTPPDVTMWRDPDGAELGFRAGTSPRDARRSVTTVTRWLLSNTVAIEASEDAVDYQDAVSLLVWQLRAASGLLGTRRGHRLDEYANDPCPRCEEQEVRVEYFGESFAALERRGDSATVPAGVEVRCMHCGWEPELRPAAVARWLTLGTAELATIEDVASVRATIARSHDAAPIWGDGLQAAWCPVCHCRGYHAIGCTNLNAPTHKPINR